MFNEKAFRLAISQKGERIADAAKVMGISRVTMYRKMIGESDFYREEIQKFCSHYNVRANDVFFAQ